MPILGVTVIGAIALSLVAYLAYSRWARNRPGDRKLSADDIDAARRDVRSSVRGTRFGATGDMQTWRAPGERDRDHP
jgi:hypothetical protein